MSSEKNQKSLFGINEYGFTFRGNSHLYSDVNNIEFIRVITTQRTNLVKVGEAESAYLTVHMKVGKPIRISFDEATLFHGFNIKKKSDIKFLIDIYNLLSRETFEQRLNQYETQIVSLGYFVYDGCYFHPPNSIVFRNREFNLDEYELIKYPFAMEIRKTNLSMMDRVAKEFSLTKTPGFSTTTDRDVIFYLLENWFGIK